MRWWKWDVGQWELGSEDNFFFNDCIVMLNFLKNNVKDTTKILPNELQSRINFQSWVNC